ncbi:MAG: hypothetical protein LBC84_01255 [Prevotellaceae bacterium]|nr:hypothetical protein [Prevotellaceae bacterium]
MEEKRKVLEYLDVNEKLTTTDLFLKTKITDDENSKISKRYINVRSLSALLSLNPYKVKIDCLGNII